MIIRPLTKITRALPHDLITFQDPKSKYLWVRASAHDFWGQRTSSLQQGQVLQAPFPHVQEGQTQRANSRQDLKTQMDSGVVFSQRKRCAQSLRSRVGHLLVIRLLSVWAAC